MTSNLPEPNFIERNPEIITKEWIALYEEKSGKKVISLGSISSPLSINICLLKKEKTTINYLKREGSKFPVIRGKEWILLHYKHFRLFHILWFEIIYDVNLASMPKSQIYQWIKAKYEDLKRTFEVIKEDIFAKLI